MLLAGGGLRGAGQHSRRGWTAAGRQTATERRRRRRGSTCTAARAVQTLETAPVSDQHHRRHLGSKLRRGRVLERLHTAWISAVGPKSGCRNCRSADRHPTYAWLLECRLALTGQPVNETLGPAGLQAISRCACSSVCSRFGSCKLPAPSETNMEAPPKSSTLPRTDVAAFLRTVGELGATQLPWRRSHRLPPPPPTTTCRQPPTTCPAAGAELRAADEFLCKTGAPAAAPQPPAPAPLLLPQPGAVAPATDAPSAGMLTSGGTGGTCSSSDAAAAAAHDLEVAALMGLMVPQHATQEHGPAAAETEAAATPAQDAHHAPAEEQPARAGRGRPAALAAPACSAAAPSTSHRTAAPQHALSHTAAQCTPPELRRSRTKVLTWLSHLGGESQQLPDDGPLVAIPAVHAAAPQPPAAQRTGWAGSSWRQPAPQRAAAPLLRSPVQRLAPADYCAQLQRTGTPRKLLLARPACHGCGQAGPACSCPAAVGAAPLRLLRPRQAPHASPGRQRGSGAGLQTRQQHDHSSMACPAGPAPSLAPPGMAACVTIQNAFFGGAGMLQGVADIGCAADQWQQAAAPPLAHLPPPPPAAGAGSGTSAGTAQAQLDVWAAYLAARRQAAAAAADGAQPSTGQGSGVGPLAQLRGIAQRIRTMQGHISSFLLRQHGDPEPTVAPLQGSPSRQRESSGAAPLPPAAAPGTLPAPAARPAQRAAAPPAQDWEPGSLFTDDFVLSMQMGTDWRRLERAALDAAAGRGGGQGAGAGSGAAQGGAQEGRSSDGTAGGGGALQRLKQAQRVVTAERVGRQAQRAPRAS